MSIYAGTARFDNARPLSEDDLRRTVPSIFAETAHHSRSDRFAPIPTIEVLRGLAKEGFMPVAARQAPVRDESRYNFTKHLIRLRRIEDDHKFHVGDTVSEVMLKNGNDGSSRYELLAGLFRIRCMNSLVAQVGTLDEVKIRHSGSDVKARVIEATYQVMNVAREALAAPETWGGVELSREERHVLAGSARMIRFGNADGQVDPDTVTTDQLLQPRRMEDDGSDLWSVWNIVQENVMRGGLHGVRRDANNQRRRFSTRPVRSIDGSINLNRALWALGQKMAELKS